MWDNVKAWFKRSESIFLARLEVFTGFLLGVVGAIDWSGLANMDYIGLSKNQILTLAGIFILKGVIAEIGRRRGTVVTTEDQLVPVNIAKKAKVEVKK